MKIIPFFVLAGLLLLVPIDYARAAGSITLSPGETLALSGIATQILPTPSTSAFSGFITVGSMVSPTDWTATAFVLTGLGLASVGFHLDPSNSTAFGTSTLAFTGGGGDSRLLTLNFVDGNNSTDIYTDVDLTRTGNDRSGTFSYTVSQAKAYYFSDLAFGENWQTTLTYVNYSPQAVTCSTTFYSDSGALLPIPFSQGTVSTRTDTLQPGQSLHDQSVGNPAAAVTQGWAQATCTGPVQASVLFRLYRSGVAVAEAGVNAETGPTTQFATFAQTATGVAYANPSATQSATITFTVYSAAGTQLGSHVITLGPLAHGSANLGPLLGLQSFTGFVKITSTIPIISLSLNFEAAPVFSSLPPGDLPGSTTLVP